MEPKENTGALLAETVLDVLSDLQFNEIDLLDAVEDRVELKYRELDELERGVCRNSSGILLWPWLED